MEKRRKNKRNFVITLIQIVLIIVIIYSLIRIILWFINSNKDKSINEDLKKSVVTIYNDSNENIKIDDETNSVNSAKEFKIDFDKLIEINSDIIGWIIIGNTNISYPVLKANDNDYYLHRNYSKEYSQAGSIFLDEAFNKIESGTIIYGHNMTDGSMFHDLSNIYDGSLGDNVIINIYTKEKNMIYSVISTYMVDPSKFIQGVSFEYLISKSNIKFNYGNVDKNDVITLYTCNTFGDKRIIVSAARVT